MVERRRHDRQPSKDSVKISVIEGEGLTNILPSPEIEVVVTDVSDTGLGLLSETSLEPGQIIKLHDRKPDWKFSDTGIVMWTIEASDGFRAGVKFD